MTTTNRKEPKRDGANFITLEFFQTLMEYPQRTLVRDYNGVPTVWIRFGTLDTTSPPWYIGQYLHGLRDSLGNNTVPTREIRCFKFGYERDKRWMNPKARNSWSYKSCFSPQLL